MGAPPNKDPVDETNPSLVQVRLSLPNTPLARLASHESRTNPLLKIYLLGLREFSHEAGMSRPDKVCKTASTTNEPENSLV